MRSTKAGTDLIVQMLHQALWGEVTPDLRRVTVTLDPVKPHIEFLYCSMSDTTHDDVVEILANFESFLETRVNFTYSIFKHDDPLIWPEHPTYVILQRKE